MVGKNLMCEGAPTFVAPFALSTNSPRYPDRHIFPSRGTSMTMSLLMQLSGKTITETNTDFIISLIQPPTFTLPFHIDNRPQKLSSKRSIRHGFGGLDLPSQ